MEDVTFIIEEAQRCLPASRQDLPDSLQRIIFLGRHFGRSLVVAAQRPSIVHIAARSQWTRIVTFNLSEVGDVRWLEGTSGYDVQTDHDIRKLPVGDYFEITPGGFERKRAPLYVPRKSGKGEDVKSFRDTFSFLNLQTI
jgi:DNA helicase HerA-like ATPase